MSDLKLVTSGEENIRDLKRETYSVISTVIMHTAGKYRFNYSKSICDVM